MSQSCRKPLLHSRWKFGGGWSLVSTFPKDDWALVKPNVLKVLTNSFPWGQAFLKLKRTLWHISKRLLSLPALPPPHQKPKGIFLWLVLWEAAGTPRGNWALQQFISYTFCFILCWSWQQNSAGGWKFQSGEQWFSVFALSLQFWRQQFILWPKCKNSCWFLVCPVFFLLFVTSKLLTCENRNKKLTK